MKKPTKQQLIELAQYMEVNDCSRFSDLINKFKNAAEYCADEYTSDKSIIMAGDSTSTHKSIFAYLLAESL